MGLLALALWIAAFAIVAYGAVVGVFLILGLDLRNIPGIRELLANVERRAGPRNAKRRTRKRPKRQAPTTAHPTGAEASTAEEHQQVPQPVRQHDPDDDDDEGDTDLPATQEQDKWPSTPVIGLDLVAESKKRRDEGWREVQGFTRSRNTRSVEVSQPSAPAPAPTAKPTSSKPSTAPKNQRRRERQRERQDLVRAWERTNL